MRKNVRATEADWIISRGVPVYAVAHAKATVRGDSTVDADLARLEEKLESRGTFTVTSAVINLDAWEETDDGYRAVLAVTGTTEDTVPLVCVQPGSSEAASQCQLQSRCTTGSGTVTVFAKLMPKDIIELTILSMFSQNVEMNPPSGTVPGTTVVSYGSLPVATRDTLGGVKIGSNIDISEDGTITAKPDGCTHVLSGGVLEGGNHVHDDECISDFLASHEEVDDALNRALGIGAEPEE